TPRYVRCARAPQSDVAGASLSLLLPRHVHLDWDVVLDRHGEERRRIDFEIIQLGWNRAAEALFISLRRKLKSHILVVSRLAGEFDIEVGMNLGVIGGGFG